jgi:hypothetical protein
LEVQAALAGAFDTCAAALGSEAALPLVEDWLSNPHPNYRRADPLPAFTSARGLKAQ